jgi:hypothetical protein
MKKLLLALLMITVCSGGLTGCASSETTSASGRNVSSIPWNRPAKWEGGGVLGSQMSAMQGY